MFVVVGLVIGLLILLFIVDSDYGNYEGVDINLFN